MQGRYGIRRCRRRCKSKSGERKWKCGLEAESELEGRRDFRPFSVLLFAYCSYTVKFLGVIRYIQLVEKNKEELTPIGLINYYQFRALINYYQLEQLMAIIMTKEGSVHINC